jgi:hypothetical protein
MDLGRSFACCRTLWGWMTGKSPQAGYEEIPPTELDDNQGEGYDNNNNNTEEDAVVAPTASVRLAILVLDVPQQRFEVVQLTVGASAQVGQVLSQIPAACHQSSLQAQTYPILTGSDGVALPPSRRVTSGLWVACTRDSQVTPAQAAALAKPLLAHAQIQKTVRRFRQRKR